MTVRRLALLATCVAVAGLGGWFAVLQWERVSRIATVISALAAVAAVGVAVWAAIPVQRRDAGRIRVANTGAAVARDGGRANTGVMGSAERLRGGAEVENTGRAEAEGGGTANSGIHLT